MKNFLLSLLSLLLTCGAFAQKTNPASFKDIIQEVLSSAQEDFVSIRGDQIGGEPGTIQFLSTKEAPGSLENKVIGYSGLKKTDWVWESKLKSFDKIEDLQTQYKKIYNEIGRGSVKSSSKSYEPVNPYEHPNEQQRIWKNQFRVANTKLIIDLVAEEIYYEWVIWLRIYNLENMEGSASF